jgi:hypothetical protein
MYLNISLLKEVTFTRDCIISLKFDSEKQAFVLKVAYHTHHYYRLSYIYLLTKLLQLSNA